MTPDPSLATFHLFRVSALRVPAAVARMALDRRPLRRTPGLRFFKLVGTGDGRTFTVRDADPTRWALFAVWESPADAERFEASSPVAAAWGRLADERWRAHLRVVRSRGTWAGIDPFPAPAEDETTGPVAALTRARIKWHLAARFWRSVPPVSAALHQQPGLRFAIGFGEAPVGLQGTLSLWDSPQALTSFAYGSEQHRSVVRATSQLQWYSEELFARFNIVRSTGTIDGRDPLDGLMTGSGRRA